MIVSLIRKRISFDTRYCIYYLNIDNQNNWMYEISHAFQETRLHFDNYQPIIIPFIIPMNENDPTQTIEKFYKYLALK